MNERGEALRECLRQQLAAMAVRALDREGQRHAAVAVPVTEAGFGADLPGMPVHTRWSDAPALLLTRRAEGLRSHAGQWALPGGRIDAGETPEQAALRELEEEVGLALDASAVLGRLDDYATRSGYLITPVVVWAGPARELNPNAAEVASVHRIPASERTDARPRARGRAPGAAHAGGQQLDRGTHRGLPLPVPRTRAARPRHPRRPLRAAGLRVALMDH
jgi:mutator protein MutT